VVARNLLNVINPLVATVSHISFTVNGEWLVTVDVRPLTPDRFEFISTLKFWHFSETQQNYELVTQVSPPHEKITSLDICPVTNVVVTAGTEGKFMMWESFALEKDGSNRANVSWRCRSVGYYRNRPVAAAKFSGDGSILAVTYGSILTLWDPKSVVLKRTLVFPATDFDLTLIQFIKHTPFIVTANKSHLCVWNLLKLSIEWMTELTTVYSLVADPILPRFSVLMKQIPFCPSVFSPASKQSGDRPELQQVLEKYKESVKRGDKRDFKSKRQKLAPLKLRSVEEAINLSTDGSQPPSKKRITEAFGRHSLSLPAHRKLIQTHRASPGQVLSFNL
jgi:WD40 repeat protein